VFAAVAIERARTYELQGDNTRALNLANEAIRMCQEASKKGQACEQYLPSMLRRRASIEAALKIFPSAEDDARRALALLVHGAPPGEVSEMIGQAYLTLASCLKAENHIADARAMAQLAARQLQETIGADHPDTRSARELADM
jgi:tetratricopeptide (TPR) repeat protein